MNTPTTEYRPESLRQMLFEMIRGLEALRDFGFRPAFFDHATCMVYPSRDAQGCPAAIHDFDTLPDELVRARTESGHVSAVKSSVTTGFERHGYFYTPRSALRAVLEWGRREN